MTPSIANVVILWVTFVSTVYGSTCVHQDDSQTCKQSKTSFPCDLIVDRLGDRPTALTCNQKDCFNILTSKKLNSQTKDCFSTITMANISNCVNCFSEKIQRPFESFYMSRDPQHNNTILDLSSNNIDSDYVENFELLNGPIENLDILYLSNNKLTSLPVSKLTMGPNLREFWVNDNDIDNIQFSNVTKPMRNLEYLNLRENPLQTLDWRSIASWPNVFPNLKVLDIGYKEKDVSSFFTNKIWFIYPILSRFQHLKVIYWPTSQVQCTCPMIAAFARYLDKDFKIVEAHFKTHPHQEYDSETYSEENMHKLFGSGDRLQRYLSYYQEEEAVVCSKDSEWGLENQQLQQFASIANTFCSDISLNREPATKNTI